LFFRSRNIRSGLKHDIYEPSAARQRVWERRLSLESKFKRLLCRWRWPDMNALQREHASLGCRTAWRGKTANLAACRQDPVARDDQGHRITRHGPANITGGFRSGVSSFAKAP
jgi:hypothetical protein